MSLKAILPEQQKSYTKDQEDALLANKVPNSRTINGHDLSQDLSLTAADVGAVSTSGTAARAYNLKFSYKITTGTTNDWIKFLEFDVNSGDTVKFVLLLTDGGNYYCGEIYGLFHDIGGNNQSSSLGWLSRQGYTVRDIKYSIAGNTVSIFLRKKTASNQLIYVLQSSTRIQDLDISSYFKQEIVEEPENADYIKGVWSDRLAVSGNIGGSAGWYKVCTLDVTQTISIIFLIKNTLRSLQYGILEVYASTTANDTTLSTVHVNWLTRGPETNEWIRWESDGLNLILYANKINGSSNYLEFYVLSAHDRYGNGYYLDKRWNLEKVSEPTNATPATANVGINSATATNAVNDANGDQIDTTYLKKSDSFSYQYGVCNTTANTQTKTVTIPGITALTDGLCIRVKFSYGQAYDGTPKLNVNSLGAKNIERASGISAVQYEWYQGTVIDFVYNSDRDAWTMVNHAHAGTLYYGITRLSDSVSSTAIDSAATSSAVKQAYDLAAAALPADGTARYAQRLGNSLTLSGGAGWYKIIEFTLTGSTNVSRHFYLSVMESYGTYAGIFKAAFRRSSSTAISASCRWITADGYVTDDLAYSADGTTGTCAVYINKKSSGTYRLFVQVFDNTSLTGALSPTDIPWYTEGTAAPLSALPDNASPAVTGPWADRAYRLVPQHSFTGTAGWYKVLELSLTSDNSYNVTLMVSDAGGSYNGLLRLYFNRSSNGTLSGGLSWLDIGLFSEQDACYALDNTEKTCSLYIRKRSGSTGGLSFNVLRAISRTGTSFSLVNCFKSEAISSLPSTVTYAYPPTGALWYSNQPISIGTNQQLLSITSAYITDNFVLAKIDFANPEYITSSYTWQTTSVSGGSGTFTLTGTCTAATTANILLVRRFNNS